MSRGESGLGGEAPIPRALVVQNGPRGGPGRFGEELVAGGLELDVRHPYGQPADGDNDGYEGSERLSEQLPERLEHQAIVVLGGGYLPDADERAPWLARTRFLVAQALERHMPVFGICLGGQVLAHVAGGTVRGEHGTPEVGSTPLLLRPEAAHDPLFRELPQRVTAIENHVDRVTALPPEAVWLASGEHCPYQAFRVGHAAWGVQFHPEVTPARVEQWDPERLRRLGFNPSEVSGQAKEDEAPSAVVWRRVARRFAAFVRARET